MQLEQQKNDNRSLQKEMVYVIFTKKLFQFFICRPFPMELNIEEMSSDEDLETRCRKNLYHDEIIKHN